MFPAMHRHGALVWLAPLVVSEQTYAYGGDPHAPSLFYGLAVTTDGKRAFVSTGGYDPVSDQKPPAEHYNPIDVYDLVGSPPQLMKNQALELDLPFVAGNQ